MTSAAREPRILLGIGFMMLAASFFPVMNGLVQWLSPRYPSEQIVWARITGQFLLMLIIMLPRAGLRVFATKRPGLQAGRSLCQLTSTSLYFAALASIPLAKAAAIGFMAPFIVALIAWPLLGERPKLRRLIAIAVAFTGVLVVIRPGDAGFQPASILILLSACAFATYQVLTRKVAPHDGPDTSTLWSALLGAVALTMLMPWFWTTPASMLDVLAFLALGAFATAGHYCVARAFSLGPAAVISPFHYWQIVGSIIMGVLLSGYWPDGATWLGASIIVCAGIYLAVAEGRGRARA
jgi:drug/metabolite transporter (DMT)-like permease